MIWQNAWAFLGLLTLALPVLIHLLARRRARPLPFPTLRFLQATQLLSVRRARLTDPLLLVIRLCILAAAVAALAQPLWLTADRRNTAASTSALAIVVDTSVSMDRLTAAGEPAAAAARRSAEQRAAEADVHVTLETATPARVLGAAADWLRAQPGRRAIVVVSDAQAAVLDSAAAARVPADIELRLERVAVAGDAVEFHSRIGGFEVVARGSRSEGGTIGRWERRPVAVDSGVALVRVLAGPDEADAAEAALEAARQVTPLRPAAPIVFVFPGYPDRAALERAAGPLDEPWMAWAAARIHRAAARLRLAPGDAVPALAAAAVAPIGALADRPDAPDSLAVLVRASDDAPLARVASLRLDNERVMAVFVRAEPGSLASAALFAAALGGAAPPPDPAELDPAFASEAALAAWQRPATGDPLTSAAPPGSAADGGASDGRWFWALALALLLLEMLVRRRTGTRSPEAAA